MAANWYLVVELANAYQEAGPGILFCYSYGADWWYPHTAMPEAFDDISRPEYGIETNHAEGGRDHERYEAYVADQIVELLKNHGPVAGIWLDGVAALQSNPEPWGLDRLYDRIHNRQTQMLVSYKGSVTSGDDLLAQSGTTPLEGAVSHPGRDQHAVLGVGLRVGQGSGVRRGRLDHPPGSP